MPTYRRITRPGNQRNRRAMHRNALERRKAFRDNLRHNMIGFPSNKVVKLRYCTNATIDATGTFTPIFFRANSPYDPTAALGGHQPLGFDQWSQFYNHYVVLGSKITWQITSGAGANNNDATLAFCYLTDDQTIGTDATLLMEQGKIKYKLLPGNMQIGSAFKLVNKYSAKRFYNIVDVKDNLDRIGAPTSTNPTEEAYFALGFQGVDSADNYAGNWNILVTIDYIVSFSEPKELASS